jgi:hypothetical protein
MVLICTMAIKNAYDFRHNTRGRILPDVRENFR